MMRLLSKLLNWRIFCIDAICYNYDMYIPEYLTIEHAIDGAIVISNPYSFVYGIGTTIEAAMNEYQAKQDVYIQEAIDTSNNRFLAQLLACRPEVLESLERSLRENPEIWQRLTDRRI
jgi:hypothetical protein